METRRRMFAEGLVAGLIGYATIAVFYAAVNLLLGRPPFSTAVTLGSHLVDPSVARRAPFAPIVAYNGLHLAVLFLIGLGASWLVYETERHPRFWLAALFTGLTGLFFSEAALLILDQPGIATLPVWSVIGANLLAGLAVGGYLIASHRRLLRQLKELGPEAL